MSAAAAAPYRDPVVSSARAQCSLSPRMIAHCCLLLLLSHPQNDSGHSSDDDHPLAPLPLTSSLTGAFSLNLAPPPLFTPSTEPPIFPFSRRPSSRPVRKHTRVAAPNERINPHGSYGPTVSALQQQATAEVSAMALRGELAVSSTITEEELEEMEVDQPLIQEAIGKLKARLSIKLRESDALTARIRQGRAFIEADKKKKKDARMQDLRYKRATMMRQKSEDEVARAGPQPDLTTQDVEPNP